MYIRDEYIPTLHELAWLASEKGRSACTEMAAGNSADTPTAISRWRERIDAEFVTAAWTQVLLRQSARSKFARADRMLFDRTGLEQASDEVVAAHKAARFTGSGRIADLCCGVGGDTIALAGAAPVVSVDISGPRATMAEHNAAAYERRAEGVIGDVELTHPDADAAHVDPDRRATGHREHDAEQGSPNLVVLEVIVRRYNHLAIKLSPGAAFDRLPFDCEIELISHRGNCKQAVAWTGRFAGAHRRATVLPSGQSIDAQSEADLAWPAAAPVEPGAYLVEPDAAVIRANLVGVLARRLTAAPIDAHIAWLVSDRAVSTPFGHTFRIIDTAPFNGKRLRPWLAGHDIGTLEIKTRGVAIRPEDVGRRLRLRGRRPGVLLITRLTDKPVAILAARESA